MKNLSYIILCVGLVFSSCAEEDTRGINRSDSEAPSPISNPVVTNRPGGAKIEYKIPKDDDLLYVQAQYELASGEIEVRKSSIFKNYVIVEGLREAETSKEVKLQAVDRSGNMSEPVTVDISPETAPIDILFETIELLGDFGGVRMNYDNSNLLNAEIQLHVRDSVSGLMTYNQSVFISNDQFDFHVFRPFESTDSMEVGVQIIDRWDNVTELKTAMVKPLKEEQIPLSSYADIVLEGDQIAAFTWELFYLYDASVGGKGYHTGQSEPGHIVPPYVEPYHMFTLDLKKPRVLSRFKFWQRQGSRWAYNHGNPKSFEIWGVDELPADNGASMENNGWVLLVPDGKTIKPSGLPPGTNSAEDVAAAAAGHELAVVDRTPVRYVRFVCFESWSGGKFFHLMELNAWGGSD
ncbi:DUF5000 domain-containing lipoprotein [Marinoscillum furvescens]|nr:DUF5000 domain-containing lipoprotein [Marinoscillum furvescens]